MTDSVRWDLDGAVATITLNRPKAHNALTAEMKTELLRALRQAAASPDVRAVLITGAGQAFCAGQDLREHAGLLEAAASAGRDAASPAGAPPAGAPAAQMPAGGASAVGAPPAEAGAGGAGHGPRALQPARAGHQVHAQAGDRRGQRDRGGGRGGPGLRLRLPHRGPGRQLPDGVRPGRAGRRHGRVLDPAPAGRGRAGGRAADARGTRPRGPRPGTRPGQPAGRGRGAAGDRGRAGARLAAGPTAAYAGIKEQLNYAAGHGLAEALDKEAEVQAALGRTADHQAATLAFTRKEQPRFLGR